MRIKNLFLILKLSLTPISIFSPIPIFCITLFLISSDYNQITSKNLYMFVLGILTSLISISASNLWNHTNDINEDTINKKNNLFINKKISQKDGIIISSILYLISFFLIIFNSFLLDRPIYYYFLIWIFITWWYSDTIFLKKIFGFRLKTHYFGELITYIIAYPAYTLSIWLIFSESLIKGVYLSIIFLWFGIAGVLLKDLKDIEGDRKAGLKTLGVVFGPSTLIKMSCIFLIFYFSTIIITSLLNILSIYTIIILIPFLYFLKKTIIPFNRKKWVLDVLDHSKIKAMLLSVYVSLVLIGFSNFV